MSRVAGFRVEVDEEGRAIRGARGVVVNVPDQFKKDRDNAKRVIENDPGH